MPTTSVSTIPMNRASSTSTSRSYQTEEMLDRAGTIWLAAFDGSYRLTRYVPGGDTGIVEVRRPRQAVSAAERDSAIAGAAHSARRGKRHGRVGLVIGSSAPPCGPGSVPEPGGGPWAHRVR
jgi:hypothetical protein